MNDLYSNMANCTINCGEFVSGGYCEIVNGTEQCVCPEYWFGENCSTYITDEIGSMWNVLSGALGLSYGLLFIVMLHQSFYIVKISSNKFDKISQMLLAVYMLLRLIWICIPVYDWQYLLFYTIFDFIAGDTIVAYFILILLILYRIARMKIKMLGSLYKSNKIARGIEIIFLLGIFLLYSLDIITLVSIYSGIQDMILVYTGYYVFVGIIVIIFAIIFSKVIISGLRMRSNDNLSYKQISRIKRIVIHALILAIMFISAIILMLCVMITRFDMTPTGYFIYICCIRIIELVCSTTVIVKRGKKFFDPWFKWRTIKDVSSNLTSTTVKV
jgi:hypothetical protein